MILIISTLVVLLIVSVVYIFLGVYIKSLEFNFGIKGFKLKIETREKSAPSHKD
ncbi:hypothetical protein [Clostridium sp. UBA4548]|uniref:hypothetical protein n=1 Tax=Clostridium sp. UBA4548 TaxID=1946361 RepID=UPI0025C740E7|nr:hypothetical protein [Clostridium sp. UBA4548]